MKRLSLYLGIGTLLAGSLSLWNNLPAKAGSQPVNPGAGSSVYVNFRPDQPPVQITVGSNIGQIIQQLLAGFEASGGDLQGLTDAPPGITSQATQNAIALLSTTPLSQLLTGVTIQLPGNRSAVVQLTNTNFTTVNGVRVLAG
ncbi:MAG: hypothetical protein VKJ46_14065, partial [Leptolyngbyaceae bacterium]|nr:hypothetical protein [Leptolyngbyaceae bacterium]